MAQMKPEHSSDLKSKWPQWKQIKWCPQFIPVRYYVLAGKANHIALRIKNDGLPWYLVGCHQRITIAFIYHARHCTKHFTYTPFTGNHYGHNRNDGARSQIHDRLTLKLVLLLKEFNRSVLHSLRKCFAFSSMNNSVWINLFPTPGSQNVTW